LQLNNRLYVLPLPNLIIISYIFKQPPASAFWAGNEERLLKGTGNGKVQLLQAYNRKMKLVTKYNKKEDLLAKPGQVYKI
jgi:hypothetical protein